MIALTLRNFTLTSGAGAIGPIDVEVPAGGRLGVVGATQTGKSLLLLALAGLRPRAVIAGTATVPRPLALVCGKDALETGLSATDNVALAVRGRAPRAARAHARELLAALAVPVEAMARTPPLLSGGQRRRVAIARALAAHPRALLLDDPTAGLDPDTAGEVLDAIAARASDATVLISGQDPDIVLPWVERAMLLSAKAGGDVAATVTASGALPAPFAPSPLPPLRLFRSNRIDEVKA